MNSAKVQMSHFTYNRKNHRVLKTTLDISSKEKCVHILHVSLVFFR